MSKRLTSALLGTALAVIVGASPAAALSWNNNAFSGTIGAFHGPGMPEVVCHYNSSARLKSITIKPPVMNGSHDELTTVGWRYQIRKGEPFHRGALVYGSRTWKDDASKTVGSAFTKKNYYITQDMPGTTLYYLRIVMFWYAPDSSTTVEGRGVVLYDYYRLKGPTQSRDGLNGACPFDYSYTETG